MAGVKYAKSRHRGCKKSMWWKYALAVLLSFLGGTLVLHHRALQEDLLRGTPLMQDSNVFGNPVFRARDLQDAGPQRAPAVLDTMPERYRLLRAQKEIFENMKRPPDAAYNINVTLSDSISLDREIDDTRPEPCKAVHYDLDSLPRTSVVIPFFNEALSMLLRTVHSVLNKTPDRLLEEVILVDDNSTYEYLHASLQKYLNLLPKVKLLRNRGREGLIRSRLRGAQISSSPIVVFLDAHTEVNVGWLEPMLAELQKHPNSIVQPFIDGIDIVNMVYSKPYTIHRGGFSWDLRYVWMKVPEHVQRAVMEEGLPFWSPTLVGCAIAVNKTFFYSIGAFDDDQYIWGGENLELAFRTWQCGGSIVTLPCSRIGHVFRPLPYRNGVEWMVTWQKNLMRVADVWMDDYKKYFYSSTRVYKSRRVDYTIEERASLRKRLKLRENLQCKNFEWYLNNVIPDLPIPPRDAVFHGEITNAESHACWAVLPDNYITMTYSCYEHKIITENIFTLTKNGLLTYKDKCVKFMYPQPALKLHDCPDTPDYKFGVWDFVYPGDEDKGVIQVKLEERRGIVNTFCAMQVTSAISIHSHQQMPQASPCKLSNRFQFWQFTYRFDFYDDFILNLPHHLDKS